MNSANLRRWQQQAIEEYQQKSLRIFACLATPASGKTRFGLAVAELLLNANEIKQVVIFCHTDQIRR